MKHTFLVDFNDPIHRSSVGPGDKVILWDPECPCRCEAVITNVYESSYSPGHFVIKFERVGDFEYPDPNGVVKARTKK